MVCWKVVPIGVDDDEIVFEQTSWQGELQMTFGWQRVHIEAASSVRQNLKCEGRVEAVAFEEWNVRSECLKQWHSKIELLDDLIRVRCDGCAGFSFSWQLFS